MFGNSPSFRVKLTPRDRQVVQAFYQSGSSSGSFANSLLELHPVLQTVVSTNQLNSDINLITGQFN